MNKHLYIIADGPVHVGRKDTYIKIGVSSNPHKRLKQIQTGNPKPVDIWFTAILCGDYEKDIHSILQGARASGGSEWFRLSDDRVSAFIAGVAIGQSNASRLELDWTESRLKETESRLEETESRLEESERGRAFIRRELDFLTRHDIERCRMVDQLTVENVDFAHQVSYLRSVLDEFGLGEIDTPPFCPI